MHFGTRSVAMDTENFARISSRLTFTHLRSKYEYTNMEQMKKVNPLRKDETGLAARSCSGTIRNFSPAQLIPNT